jgi:L-iditol 2-dehydrogenase
MANKGIDLSPLVTTRFEASEAVGAIDAAQDPANNIKAHIQFTATL